MSTIHAAEIIRRLRSNGVKVYLGKQMEVTFSSLEEVSPALKQEIIQHGPALRDKLIEEQETRRQRERMRKPAVRRRITPEVRSEEL